MTSFNWVREIQTAFGNSDLPNLRPKFSKIYFGLLWSDQWQTVRTASPGKTRGNLRGVSLHSWDIVSVCVCVCAHIPFYKSVHVCLILFVAWCHLCPQRDILFIRPTPGASTYRSSFSCRQPVDWQGQKQVEANKWCCNALARQQKSSLISPLPLLLIVFLLPQIPVGLFVILANTSKRAGQQTLPRNFTISEGFVLLLMMPILESLVGVYSNCLLVPVARTIPSHQTASDGWLN